MTLAVAAQGSGSSIATEDKPCCPLCGVPGHLLHDALTDELFGVSGAWRMRKCDQPDCGLLWLDPMPQPSEVGKAYERVLHARCALSRLGTTSRVQGFSGAVANEPHRPRS